MIRSIGVPWRTETGETEVRRFEMNDAQAHVYNDILDTLVAGNVPREQAETVMSQTVLTLLDGKMPRESDTTALHRLRIHFPTLTPARVAALPVAGCPNGRIEKLVLYATREDAAPELVLFELTAQQADLFNTTLAEIEALNDWTRDQAWTMLTMVVGGLTCGAPTRAHNDRTDVVDRLRAEFPQIDVEAFEALPRATEDDVRRWSFREPTLAPNE